MLQLIGLLKVKNTEGIQVLGATNLELDHISAPLDFHRTRILPTGCEEEVLNLMNLLRHFADFVTIGTGDSSSYSPNQ